MTRNHRAGRNRAKPPTNRKQARAAIQKAVAAQEAPSGHHPSLNHVTPQAEHACYRTVGSVMERDGRYIAMGESGKVMGEFGTKWEAWRMAEKLGLERIEA